MTALTIEGVTKKLGSTEVLHGIDLYVPPGGLTAILGPSGCGKTTLLRLVAGFADPDSGRIRFGDQIVYQPGMSIPPQQRRVGYVPQEGALFPHLDVASNIAFGLPRRVRRHSRHRVEQLLEMVGLSPEMKSRLPHELSGGQQQRVALARALAPGPALVLLDEPFASLDASLRDSTRRHVAQALQAADATAVLVTHDQDEALSLADQVAVMREGRLVQIGSPEDVYRNPVDIGVAEFVGAAVVIQATVSDGRAATPLGVIPVTANEKDQTEQRIMLRPEQIRMHVSNGAEGVAASVTEIAYFGHDAFVRLETEREKYPVLTRVMGGELPSVGDVVHIDVDGFATSVRAASDD